MSLLAFLAVGPQLALAVGPQLARINFSVVVTFRSMVDYINSFVFICLVENLTGHQAASIMPSGS